MNESVVAFLRADLWRYRCCRRGGPFVSVPALIHVGFLSPQMCLARVGCQEREDPHRSLVAWQKPKRRAFRSSTEADAANTIHLVSRSGV